MKRILPKFILTFAVALATSGTVSAENIKPTSVDQSDCKGTRMFEESSSEITYENGILTLTVNDVEANCAAVLSVECKTDIPGEIHFIVDDTSEESANCICMFDVECKYEGILTGHYDIYVELPYGEIIHKTTADIAPGCNIVISKTTGISMIANESGKLLRVGENGLLAVTADGITVIDIYDASGVRCASFNVEGVSNVALDTLPNGVYLIKATNGKRTESIKFVR